MFTITADKVLPCTITGSWPRPRWFDMSMWGRPLDTCMMDVRFREKFQDVLATVISDQDRAWFAHKKASVWLGFRSWFNSLLTPMGVMRIMRRMGIMGCEERRKEGAAA